MSGSRRELHVAQQARREKLRIQNSFELVSSSTSSHPSVGFINNNLDLVQVRNVRNGGHNINNNMLVDDDAAAAAAFYSSEMISFSTPAPPPSNPRNTLECQVVGASAEPSRLMMPPLQYTSLFPHSSSSNIIHSSPKEDWRNSCNPHQVSDWMLNNYGSCSSVPSSNFLANSEFNNVLTDAQSCQNSTASAEMARREIQKHVGEMHYPPPSSSNSSPPLYHNALQDIFKSASSINPHVSEMATWGGNSSSSEHVHFGNQANIHYGNLWPLSNDCNNPPHQGLCLSLSSNSQSKVSSSQFEEGSASDDPHQYSKPMNVKAIETLGTAPSPSSTGGYRNIGPLGPFTGYATILKSSRFLKPCQDLLDECCQKSEKSPKWVSRENYSANSASAADVDESAGVAGAAKGPGGSSSMLYSAAAAAKENSTSSGDGGGGKSNSTSFCVSSSRPECQKNKAKLLYMQEEVTRRYKQYHQQMQMVVSSFDSVAGLSSATPYISLALKSIARHFRCLKNAISDQLKHTCEVLGEEFSMPSTSTSGKIVDNNMTRVRCNMDQSYQKNKSNMDFLEPHQQHVWRPQRGLPERSVAILKAWLFEHFLHPYPTDTDKHMLASQTGLSRNQVSNWFINARVRVWKPMVEEIHMLETKGPTETHQNEGPNSATEVNNHTRLDDQHMNKFGNTTHAIIPEKQFQCLEMGSSSAMEKGTDHDEEQWNQEKRSKYGCEIAPAPSMDETVMGFMPYRRGGLEFGPGLGSVSLTLGLRHEVDGAQHQHQQQQLQHEEELRRQFGGHMIHDFVG